MSTSTEAVEALETTGADVVPGLVCACVIDGQLYGVPVSAVQEVMRERPLTPVPQASSAVLGLLNLRGVIVVAVDLRRRLGLPDRGPDTEAMYVIVRSRREVVALVVDEIGDVLPLEGPLVPSPATLPPRVGEVVTGATRLGDRTLLLLDPDAAGETWVDHSLPTG